MQFWRIIFALIVIPIIIYRIYTRIMFIREYYKSDTGKETNDDG